MGKATGFMELDRVERSYEPAEDRIKHFKEFFFLDLVLTNRLKQGIKLALIIFLKDVRDHAVAK